jgi:hypothetical protein
MFRSLAEDKLKFNEGGFAASLKKHLTLYLYYNLFKSKGLSENTAMK